jgi:glycosyltransferase involved in cell wall biosynthesis
MSGRSMTICLVSQEYPPETGGGGIGTQTCLRARGLSARGHAVHVVAMSWDKVDRTYAADGATIHRVGEPLLGVPGYEESTYWLECSRAVAAKIASLEDTIKFDIVQFAEYGGEGFIYQTDTFAHRQAKYVVQMHGPLAMFSEHWGWPEVGSPLHRIGCFMEATSLRYADKLLASSRHTAAYCQRAYGVDTTAAGIVYSGVDVGRFAPTGVVASGDHARPRILFVGGLAGGKGITDLLRATSRLKKGFPALVLRAIGKGTPEERAALDRLIAEHDLARNVEMLGYVPYDQLPAQYAWADVFAAPSVYEGGPGNVYLEAMASGNPIVACDTGGIPEVILHGETGLLVPPRDIDAIETALATLVDDPDLRDRLGRAARRRAVEHFSVAKYLEACEAHYRELL